MKRLARTTRRAHRPDYRDDVGERRFRGMLVKKFRQAAPNQRAILRRCQQLGWPTRITDPLPRAHGIDAGQRLHDAINGLNRHQKQRLVRVHGDGTGRALYWTIVPPPRRRRRAR